MRLSYAPTRQFSAALVILCEELRYAHISRELPGNWYIGRIAALQCAASEKALVRRKSLAEHRAARGGR